TTHWMDAPELAARYPAVQVDPDTLYADGGGTLTSAGFAAGIDLCLHLVRTDYGAEAAIRVARRMVVAPHREGGQAQFLERPLPESGEGMAAICDWALRHLAEPLTVADLARQAGWSARTFARRFTAEIGMPPHRWLAAQRVLEARRLLEQTDLPVDEVARRSGLGTAANLRFHLRRDAATTPTAYRRAYRGRTWLRSGVLVTQTPDETGAPGALVTHQKRARTGSGSGEETVRVDAVDQARVRWVDAVAEHAAGAGAE